MLARWRNQMQTDSQLKQLIDCIEGCPTKPLLIGQEPEQCFASRQASRDMSNATRAEILATCQARPQRQYFAHTRASFPAIRLTIGSVQFITSRSTPNRRLLTKTLILN